jgi:hypothetical protein
MKPDMHSSPDFGQSGSRPASLPGKLPFGVRHLWRRGHARG